MCGQVQGVLKPKPMCAAHAVAFKAEPTLQPRLPEEQEFRFLPFSRLPAFTQAGL